MLVRQVVGILSELIQDGAIAVQQRHGSQTPTMAREMRSLLSTHLCGELSYASLWEKFKIEPAKTAVQLTGVLEMLVEANPALAREMDVLLKEYNSTVAPRTPRIRPGLQSNIAFRSDVPDTAVMIEADGNIGTGNYLYGNVRPGSVGRGVRVEGSGRGLIEKERIPNDARGGSSLDDLEVTVDTYPGIDQAAKTEIKGQLHRILALAGTATEKDEDLVVRACALFEV